MRINCELVLEPHSDACRDFDKLWTSAVKRVLQRKHFVIDAYALNVTAENGQCHASMAVSDGSRQTSFEQDPEADPPELAPDIARSLSVLQKACDKSLHDPEKKALYAALSVDGNTLQTSQQPAGDGEQEPERTPTGEGGDSAKTRGNRETHLEQSAVMLASLNVASGTYRSSDRQTVSLSRIFNDNFHIDVSEITPSIQLTNTGRRVVALTPQQELALADKLGTSLETVKAALGQGDLVSPPVIEINGSEAREEVK